MIGYSQTKKSQKNSLVKCWNSICFNVIDSDGPKIGFRINGGGVILTPLGLSVAYS